MAFGFLILVTFLAFYGSLAIKSTISQRATGHEDSLRSWLYLHGTFQLVSYANLVMLIYGIILVAPKEPSFSQELGVILEYSFLFASFFVYGGSVLNLVGQNYEQLTTMTLRGAAAYAGMASLILKKQKAKGDAIQIQRAFDFLGSSLKTLNSHMQSFGASIPESIKARAVLEILQQSDDIRSVPRESISALAQTLSTISNYGDVSSVTKAFLEAFTWSSTIEVSPPRGSRTRYDILVVLAATIGGVATILTALIPVLPQQYGSLVQSALSTPDTVSEVFISVLLGVSFWLSRKLSGPVPFYDTFRY